MWNGAERRRGTNGDCGLEEVPTWSEFEILQARFEAMGVRWFWRPAELEFDGKQLAAKGKKIDLVYGRV